MGVTMLNQNDKLERFAEIINKNALAQCKKIEKQTEKFRKEQLKELEGKAKAELESRLEYEAQRIRTQTGSKISSLVSESKKSLAQKREEITERVFEQVREQLVAFSKTEEYKAFLKRVVEALLLEIGENAVVYVREEDLAFCESELSKAGSSVRFEKSGEIKLGGASASNPERTVFAVDTLESRLASQREVFMAQSALSIE